MCLSITHLLTCPVVTTSLIAAAQTYSSLLMLVVASVLPTFFYRFAGTKGSSYILRMSHFVRTNIFFKLSLLMAADSDCVGPAYW